MTGPEVVVLIPESTRKHRGGETSARPVDAISAALPAEDRRALENLRDDLAGKSAASIDSGGLLPAYRRFDGNMYRRISLEDWEGRRPDVEVVIVSGLRGILASRDTVPAYKHSMAEPLPGFGKLNRWWRDAGLSRILAAYLRATGPKTVVDLLSHEYRDAVRGLEEGLRGISVKPIDFPGMGRASQPRRGETVAKILRTGKP